LLLILLSGLIKNNGTLEQRRRINSHIAHFIQAGGVEQKHRLSGHVPKTADEYLANRLHAAGCYPAFLALE